MTVILRSFSIFFINPFLLEKKAHYCTHKFSAFAFIGYCFKRESCRNHTLIARICHTGTFLVILIYKGNECIVYRHKHIGSSNGVTLLVDITVQR